MIELDEEAFVKLGSLYLAGNDCLMLADKVFYRQQLLAQMLEWA